MVNFSGVITIDNSDVHAKRGDPGSMIKVTEVTLNIASIWMLPDCKIQVEFTDG